MSNINIFKLVGIFHELENKFENILPCFNAYEKDKLNYTQEIKLLPKIVELLEKKYGIETAVKEFHLVVYDIGKTMSSIREDVNKKEYVDAGIQLYRVSRHRSSARPIFVYTVFAGARTNCQTTGIFQPNQRIDTVQQYRRVHLFYEGHRDTHYTERTRCQRPLRPSDG